MANINTSKLETTPVAESTIEIVERKGLGHPDTICDSLSEELSIELSKLYQKEFGSIVHHNVDKALLIGGEAKPQIGGGKIIQPIEIYLSGRAIKKNKGKNLQTDQLAINTAKKWIKNNLPNLDPNKHVKIIPKLKPGSQDLVELFKRFQLKKEIPLANDTSFGTGFAPFSDTEKILLVLENKLNNRKFKKTNPHIGEDIKIMGVRKNNKITVTLAVAFVDKYVKTVQDYIEKKQNLNQYVLQIASSLTKHEIEININTADKPEKESIYLTVTGTSSEMGDDGQVGRGNRSSGLITPYRPMSLEAAAGKNPVSHVGKIYNAAAMSIAQKIVDQVDKIQEVYCYLVSQIGKPITQPLAADLKIRYKNKPCKRAEKQAIKIANQEIEQLPNAYKKFLKHKYQLF